MTGTPRCAILAFAVLRVWPSGKAKASQAFIRGFESRHPLQAYYAVLSNGVFHMGRRNVYAPTLLLRTTDHHNHSTRFAFLFRSW